jgi:hypothetical protein
MTISGSTASNGLIGAAQGKTDSVNMQISLDVLKQKFEQDTRLVSELVESGDTSTHNYGPDGQTQKPGQVVDRFA